MITLSQLIQAIEESSKEVGVLTDETYSSDGFYGAEQRPKVAYLNVIDSEKLIAALKELEV